MLKLYSLVILLVIILLTGDAYAQKQILYSEDFNLPTNTFNLNSGGPAGANSGVNNWIVDTSYGGKGAYPNTPNESHTSGGGGITKAPNSNYLHIHDSNSPNGASNANYDTSQASDNFAEMGTDICTLGFDTISFNFYYIAEGNANDFGQLYYSLDGGGSWVLLTPPSPLNNTNLWKYVIVSNPIFANQATLRFGFRWTNTGASPPKDVSIGVDDIIVVGTQDPLNKPTLTISNISPATVCLGGNALITITQSKPLCDGNYTIALSSPNGSFNGGVISFSVPMAAGTTTESFFLNFPFSLAEGNCYKLKISRADPPFITGNQTTCFTLKNCGDSIQTLQPVVLFGPDTACTQSVIDVPFWSYGKYYKGNTYIAQISNPDGTFPASPTSSNFLGQSSGDSTTYDPSQVPSPGSVSGVIPNVPPGCNYYIRVIATNPSTVPIVQDYYGPFCLRQCDVETNNIVDVHVCITPTTGDDTTISLKINQWNTNTKYLPPNDSFKVQVLSSKSYAILNTGTFGVVVSSTSTTLTLSIPDLPQVIALLGSPGTGMYYLRLIPLHSSNPYNNYGTLIRLIIGSINPPGDLILFSGDSAICSGGGGTVFLEATPPNTSSNYQWQVDPRLGFPAGSPGQPFYSPYPPPYFFGISFPPGYPQGRYWFSVREINNGCFSPWFDSTRITILPNPSANAITSLNTICEKDTLAFKVNFTNDTYYQWASTKGRVVDTSNNTLKLLFDSTGTATISVLAINKCGQSSGTKNVTIFPRPNVIASNDTSVCPEQPVTLSSTGSVVGGTVTYKWTDTTADISASNSFLVESDTKQTYIVSAVSDKGCKGKDTVVVSIYTPPKLIATTSNIACYGGANGSASLSSVTGAPPYQVIWNTDPEQTTSVISNLEAGNYVVVVTDSHSCTADTSVVINEPPPLYLSFATQDITYGGTDGSAEVVPDGGTPPYSYQWNTDPIQTGNTLLYLGPGTYAVTVTDANGCTQVGAVELNYRSNSIYVPNAFSPNGDGQNDEFDYFGNNIKGVYMAIFDRWGEKVFETENLNVRWDGTYKGQLASEGAYAYFIKVTFLDGSGKIVKGNVTLLR